MSLPEDFEDEFDVFSADMADRESADSLALFLHGLLKDPLQEDDK